MASTLAITALPSGFVEVLSTERDRGPNAGPASQRVAFRAADVLAWAPHAAEAAQWYVSTKCRAEGDGSEQAGELWAVIPGVNSTTADSVRDARREAAGEPGVTMHCVADHATGRSVTSVEAGPFRGVSVQFASPASLVTVVRAMRTQAERAVALDATQTGAATPRVTPGRGGLTSPTPAGRHNRH